MFRKKKKIIISLLLAVCFIATPSVTGLCADVNVYYTSVDRPQYDVWNPYIVVYSSNGTWLLQYKLGMDYVYNSSETETTAPNSLMWSVTVTSSGVSAWINILSNSLWRVSPSCSVMSLSYGSKYDGYVTYTRVGDMDDGVYCDGFGTIYNVHCYGFGSVLGVSNLVGTPFTIVWGYDGSNSSSEIETGVDNANKEAEEREKEYASEQGNDSVNESSSSISDESESLKSGTQNFISGISTESTSCNWTFPAITLPATSVTPSVTLSEERIIDFQTYFDMIPNEIMMIVRYSLFLGLAFYACKEFYELVFSLLTGEFVDTLYRKG